MRKPLVTGGGTVDVAPLLLLDITAGDVRGSSYVFCYTPRAAAPMALFANQLADLLVGKPLAPRAVAAELYRAFLLIGPQGMTGLVGSAIDMACWDAVAKHAGLPLCRMLGAEPKPIPAYNSRGLGLIGPEKAGREARELVEEAGFTAIKVRLGYPDVETDVEVVEELIQAVPNEIVILSDYNQCLDLAEATWRIKSLDALELAWIEEPLRADDYAGYAELASRVDTPIQLGENSWGVADMQKAVEAGTGDLFMPDAGKIGGVTGWMAAAGIAAGRGLRLSSHLYPEVSSHLLAATPTAHWFEYVDWANPVLKQPVEVVDGTVTPSSAPGIGIEWDERAVKRYLM
jgi:mandelate racemase